MTALWLHVPFLCVTLGDAVPWPNSQPLQECSIDGCENEEDETALIQTSFIQNFLESKRQSPYAKRRSELEALMCAKEVLPGVRLHVVERLRDQLYVAPPRYVFAATTGHSGSTSMSSSDAYAPGLQKDGIAFRFEAFEAKTKKEKKGGGWKKKEDDRLAWQMWWDSKPSLEEQIDRVSTVNKPKIDAVLTSESKHTYVDLGHHIVMGILGVVPAVFGDEAFFVRLKRDRLHVAYSFAEERTVEDFCQFKFRICPLKDEVILQPSRGNWTAALWNSLSLEQQAFWYIDEIEAVWQRMLVTYPDTSFLDCSWVDNLGPCLEGMARVLGVEVAPVQSELKHHTEHGLTDEVIKSLTERDAEYHAFMRN